MIKVNGSFEGRFRRRAQRLTPYLAVITLAALLWICGVVALSR